MELLIVSSTFPNLHTVSLYLATALYIHALLHSALTCYLVYLDGVDHC